MQLVFADANIHFLQHLEQLFRRARIHNNGVVPVIVHKHAAYVYNALPR